jgi:hypothetical protein
VPIRKFFPQGIPRLAMTKHGELLPNSKEWDQQNEAFVEQFEKKMREIARLVIGARSDKSKRKVILEYQKHNPNILAYPLDVNEESNFHPEYWKIYQDELKKANGGVAFVRIEQEVINVNDDDDLDRLAEAGAVQEVSRAPVVDEITAVEIKQEMIDTDVAWAPVTIGANPCASLSIVESTNGLAHMPLKRANGTLCNGLVQMGARAVKGLVPWLPHEVTSFLEL